MSAERKDRLLLLVGGSPIHDTPELRSVLSGFLRASGKLDVTLTDDLSALAADSLAGYDVVANYTSLAEPTAEQIAALVAAVQGGKGFVGIHGATVTFGGDPSYVEMLGSKFITHDAFKRFKVRIVDPEHPITAGIADFEINDELYVVEGDATRWHVLARAEGHPLVYNKTFGKGRVHYNALGHDSRGLGHPSFQALLLRGIEWVRTGA